MRTLKTILIVIFSSMLVLGVVALLFIPLSKNEQAQESEHEHIIAVAAAVAPTCISVGRTEGQVCYVCGEVLVEQKIIPKLPHTEAFFDMVLPTCTSEGKTAGTYCSYCGEILVRQEPIAKLPHSPESHEVLEATCTTDGRTVGSHCSECGEILEGSILPALGHICDEYYYCSRCEDVDTRYVNYVLQPGELTCWVYGGTEDLPCDLKVMDRYKGALVTAVGEYAFRGRKNLHSVELPSRITHIHSQAFMRCSSLSTVTLSEQLQFIGFCAFYEVPADLHIPSTVTRIEPYACSVGIPDVVDEAGHVLVAGIEATIYCPYSQEPYPSYWGGSWENGWEFGGNHTISWSDIAPPEPETGEDLEEEDQSDETVALFVVHEFIPRREIVPPAWSSKDMV